MEEKEMLLKEIKGLIADASKEGVKKADLDKTIADLNTKIAQLKNEDIDALPAKVNELIAENARLAGEVKAMNEKATKQAEKPMTLADALVAAVKESAKNVPSLVTERTENGQKKISMRDYFLKLGNKQTPEMVVKGLVDMSEANVVQSNVNTVRLTSLDPNRVGTPLAIYAHVVDWMPVKPVSGKFMSILVVYDYQDGAGTKTQGSTASKSSFLLKTVEFVTATIGTKFRVTDESLDDLPEIMQEIAIVAPSKIKDNIDYQILGAAGDDTSTIKGILAASKKTDFASATTYAASIPNANRVDCLSLMKDQAETSKYMVDEILLNPLTVRKLAAEKDQLDNSKVDRRVAFDALGEPVAICGMMIRRNTNIAAGAAVVLANNMVQIGDRKQMTLEVGYDGNDFTEGWKTVRINVRLAFAVRDPLAVIYCSDLDAAVTAITIV
jgi:regulator of replication initiation timing